MQAVGIELYFGPAGTAAEEVHRAALTDHVHGPLPGFRPTHRLNDHVATALLRRKRTHRFDIGTIAFEDAIGDVNKWQKPRMAEKAGEGGGRSCAVDVAPRVVSTVASTGSWDCTEIDPRLRSNEPSPLERGTPTFANPGPARAHRQASAQRFDGGAETIGLKLVQLLLSAPDETCQVNFRQSRLVGLELLQSPPERELASDA